MEMFSSYDERFSTYSDQLIAFAEKHNLLIEKYCHDASIWSFCFEHPLGGQSKLDLSINENGALKISTVWWYDEYSQFTRSIRWGESEEIEYTELLTDILDRHLDTVLNWKFGEWSQIANEYKGIWDKYSESEFNSMTPDWPKAVP